jgi:hypothetical protein
MIVAVVCGNIVNVPPELKELGNPGRIYAAGQARHGVCDPQPQGTRRPVSVQDAPTVSSALVPIAASNTTASFARMGCGLRADFLTQLIATVARLPQTRVRRRAEPEQAIAAYGARDRSVMQHRPTLSRSL